MENFEFVSPTHFVFGHGAENQVGEKLAAAGAKRVDRKSTRLNSSHSAKSRMPSSA